MRTPEPPSHYFSADPQGPVQARTIIVSLAGRMVMVQTAAGIFSPDHLDEGTAALLREAPAPPTAGALLDLGCGWGPIALTLGLLRPDQPVYAVDVNSRALALTAANATSLGLDRVRAMLPEAVPDDLEFSAIWSNPPIRIGKAALHDMLRTWLPRLAPTGQALLVVNKNLGADSLARWISTDLGLRCDRLASSRGFRVLAVTRG